LQLNGQGEDPLLVAGRNWEAEVKRMLEDAEHLSNEQYIEIRYEDLIKHPKTVMHQVLDFCDLRWSSRFEEHMNSFSLENRNFKWASHYRSDQIEKFEAHTQSTLQLLGYV
jgi:hypothetical protein